MAVDCQYVVLDEPTKVSVDLEISWAHRMDLDLGNNRFINLIGFFPAILVGSKSLYAGAKLVNIFDSGNARVTVPGGFGGVSIGGDLKNFGDMRIFGETSFFPRSDESLLIFYTFGVQVIFNAQ